MHRSSNLPEINEENPLPIQRVIVVEFEAGDYFDRVTITQKPRL